MKLLTSIWIILLAIMSVLSIKAQHPNDPNMYNCDNVCGMFLRNPGEDSKENYDSCMSSCNANGGSFDPEMSDKLKQHRISHRRLKKNAEM